jgi:hypothetical protein
MSKSHDENPPPQSAGAPDLGSSTGDYLTSALKVAAASASFIPLVGPLLAPILSEFFGYIVPKQRSDRLAAFSRQMEERLDEESRDRLAERLRTPEGADIMEDALLMAARTLTDERRQAIANLLVTSLTAEELRYQESKKLLQLLNELQDPEIIMLRYFYLLTQGDPEMDAFQDLHETILQPGSDEVGQPEEESARGALYEARKATISRLGLTTPRNDTRLNRLGFMLVRYIGLAIS